MIAPGCGIARLSRVVSARGILTGANPLTHLNGQTKEDMADDELIDDEIDVEESGR